MFDQCKKTRAKKSHASVPLNRAQGCLVKLQQRFFGSNYAKIVALKSIRLKICQVCDSRGC
jgi:hypothetical protein